MGKLHYYLIPGMGADRRIYQNYELVNGEIHFLEWEKPRQAKNFEEYAIEIAERIKTDNNVLVGSSMGGMMAVELSKHVKVEALILISAPTGIHQFPPILKWTKKSRIHRVFRPSAFRYLKNLADTFMGFKTPTQRAMFYEMMDNLGPEFIHFSVRALLEWQNNQEPKVDYLQIVGSKDVLFDYKKMKNPIVLENGGHFSCFDRSSEICEIINAYFIKKNGPSETFEG